jgi:very-short-patch-repair endonuclease
MEFARKYKDKIIDLYVRQGLSTYQIAEILQTNSTKILRALDFLGIERRSYSAAQSKALSTGRAEHPTKGKALKETAKLKIGRARSNAWKQMNPDDYEYIRQLNKDKWNSMTESQKQELREKALDACRAASRSGSKTEKHLLNRLVESGYEVEAQKTHLVPHSSLKVDLFLPEIKTAIEVDGPTHFLPIWGEDKLQKQQSADIIKQGILMDAGYAIIRVKQIDKSISITKMNDLFDSVYTELRKIEKQFPERSKRLIEIEVNDGSRFR